jgi:hypothetical protein
LGGEGLNQLDLFLAEGPRLSAPQTQEADNSSFPQQGDAERSAHADKILQPWTVVFGVGQDIRNVDRAAFDYGAPEK